MKSTANSLEELRTAHKKMSGIYRPGFYRISDPGELKKFNALLSQPGITLVDFIFDQVKELVKISNPSIKYTGTQLDEAAREFIGSTPPDEYGVWVHYPWSGKLVHILDKKEFIDVRTSRNQYKITLEEREILAQKKIGVIGLSVGQSVSITLIMERICGEIRLADFDILELTNLNRIRTGVYNLGLAKVYSVAREIAEIDPFINVVCFPKGLNEENMDEFFTGGGNLDLLVEESDGFDIKILSRYKARELKIPVIMEASDRCMVDVERFDLEPNRGILHGLVDHLDVQTLRSLKTNEEKMPYMLDVLGIDTSSLRLKASMLEIEQTITTWPQLSSAVTMGGGITADVSRRLLLNSYTESGRYYVDIEQIIGNKNEPAKDEALPTQGLPTISLPALGKLVSNKGSSSEQLTQQQAAAIAEAGCKAPSGGNAQPWRWVYKDSTLYLFNAFDSGASFLGYGNLASYVGMGAAAQNVMLSAAAMGFETTASIFPDSSIKELVMSFGFHKSAHPAAKNDARFNAIGTRLTNRMLGKREPVDEKVLQQLLGAVQETEGATLTVFTRDEELDAIAGLLGELEKIRLMEKSGHKDFVEELRWTAEENDARRDGVDLRTLDLNNSEKVGLEIAKDPQIMNLLNSWHGGGAFKKLTKKSIDAAGAVGIITMPGAGKENYIKGGMALQRAWLDANAAGVAFQPMAAPVFLYARLLQGQGQGLGARGQENLRKLRPVFEKTFLIPENHTEIFIFRLSKAAEPEIKSLRKPPGELFCYM